MPTLTPTPDCCDLSSLDGTYYYDGSGGLNSVSGNQTGVASQIQIQSGISPASSSISANGKLNATPLQVIGKPQCSTQDYSLNVSQSQAIKAPFTALKESEACKTLGQKLLANPAVVNFNNASTPPDFVKACSPQPPCAIKKEGLTVTCGIQGTLPPLAPPSDPITGTVSISGVYISCRSASNDLIKAIQQWVDAQVKGYSCPAPGEALATVTISGVTACKSVPATASASLSATLQCINPNQSVTAVATAAGNKHCFNSTTTN